MEKRALITGINGQDGAYLSNLLLLKGYVVIGLIRNPLSADLYKLKYVKSLSKIKLLECDLNNYATVEKIIENVKPTEIYHLAAQSSVSNSFQDPISALSFNIGSTTNLLEGIRKINSKIKFFHASSSEMYGHPKCLPIREDHLLHPINPYGVSKAGAYLITQVYRNSFNIFACNGILFNHESFLRDEKFFIKKVIKTAIEISRGEKEFLFVGNINIKRDFGFAPAYVEGIWLLMQKELPDDVILSSGQSVSLKEIIIYIFDKLGIEHEKIVTDKKLYRPADVEDIYGDNSKARLKTGWDYKMNFFEVLNIIIEEEILNKHNSRK